MDPEYGTTGIVFPGPPPSPVTPVPAASNVGWVRGWLDGRDLSILDIHASHVRGDSLGGPLRPIGIEGTIRGYGIDLFGARVDSTELRIAWNHALGIEARAFRTVLTCRLNSTSPR
jgi:hypothetical protein